METECYCTSFRTATRKISAVYDAWLEPIGVNVAQWSLLRKVDASATVKLSIGELADRAELERSTVARNVRVLEKHGLVELGVSAEDRRASAIALTAKGRNALEQGEPLWQSAQRQIEELLGVQTASDLRSLLLSIQARPAPAIPDTIDWSSQSTR